MKTIAFTGVDGFTVAGPTFANQQFDFSFVIDKSDVIIKEITPVSSCLLVSVADPSQDVTFDFKTSAKIRTTGIGKLFYSPVVGISSTNEAFLMMNQINKVDIRLFSGQSIGLVMPWAFHSKYNAGDDFMIVFECGFIVSYEEVDFKMFK